MPPKSKMVSKKCPGCNLEVAVATRNCQCGYTFFDKRRTSLKTITDAGTSEGVRRRTERNRRETQLYGISLPPEPKRARCVKNKTNSGRRSAKLTCSTEVGRSGAAVDEDTNSEEGGSSTVKRRRGRKPKEEKIAERESEILAKITPEKMAHYGVVLSEINRKLCSQAYYNAL